MSGTHASTEINGATLLQELFVDVARHMRMDTDIKNSACSNSKTLTMPQQDRTTDC